MPHQQIELEKACVAIKRMTGLGDNASDLTWQEAYLDLMRVKKAGQRVSAKELSAAVATTSKKLSKSASMTHTFYVDLKSNHQPAADGAPRRPFARTSSPSRSCRSTLPLKVSKWI